MYIPKAYREERPEELLGFMRAHSFITLISVLDGVPFASHIPVAVAEEGDVVVLRGHLAKANPQARAFGAGEALAIFSGPHAYISPSLYEKRESVPTWNYIAVHAYGPLRAIHAADDKASVEAALRELIAANEGAYQDHWDSLLPAYRDGMMQGIVGFEMAVVRLEGKYKLSQNRSAVDRHAVAAALSQSSDPAAQATGVAMRRTLDGARE
ncbi:MAG TPA: FMN-binding negative transcriptional regulator [Roseiflexaceae bacterium]|nr:FMN-binding negative transcriptional regulator [Roseiflexaceae bacterium]